MSNQEEMLAMMEESFGRIKKGEIVDGTVVSIDESNIVVMCLRSGNKSKSISSIWKTPRAE